MKLLLMTLLSVLIIGLSGCGGGGDTKESSGDQAAQTPSSILQENGNDVEELVEQFYQIGHFGEIVLTKTYTIPEGALFLDIRNPWERAKGYPEGSVDGAVYEYRKSNGHGGEEKGHRQHH